MLINNNMKKNKMQGKFKMHENDERKKKEMLGALTISRDMQ